MTTKPIATTVLVAMLLQAGLVTTAANAQVVSEWGTVWTTESGQAIATQSQNAGVDTADNTAAPATTTEYTSYDSKPYPTDFYPTNQHSRNGVEVFNGYIALEANKHTTQIVSTITSPVYSFRGGEADYQFQAKIGADNKGPIGGVGIAARDHDNSANAMFGVQAGELAFTADYVHDLVERRDQVLAVGFGAKVTVQGIDVGPSIEFGNSGDGSRLQRTIKFTPFDIQIGERLVDSNRKQNEWQRKHYSFNPIMIIIGVLAGQKTALDVLGIPAQQLNPLQRFLGLFMEVDQ